MLHNKLSRRRVMAGTAGISAATILHWPANAAEFSYKLGSSSPMEHPAMAHDQIAVNKIKQETNGRLEITIYPNSVLGGDTAMIAQVIQTALGDDDGCRLGSGRPYGPLGTGLLAKRFLIRLRASWNNLFWRAARFFPIVELTRKPPCTGIVRMCFHLHYSKNLWGFRAFSEKSCHSDYKSRLVQV